MTIAKSNSTNAVKKTTLNNKLSKYTRKIEKKLQKITKYINKCDEYIANDKPLKKFSLIKKPVLVIDADSLRTLNLDNTKIIYCNMNGNIFRNISNIKLLEELYSIGGIGMVIYHTTLNLCRTKIDDPNFINFTDLKLSIQKANNNQIMTEIIHIATILRITLKIKIMINNKNILLYRS
jgi:hypothetical protein